MIAAVDWGALLIGGCAVAVGAVGVFGVDIDRAITSLWQDVKVRRADRINARTWLRAGAVYPSAAKIVEGAPVTCPRTAAPSTLYDWADEPDELPVFGARDSLAGGTDVEAAQAAIDRRFAEILRGESRRIHPSNGAAT